MRSARSTGKVAQPQSPAINARAAPRANRENPSTSDRPAPKVQPTHIQWFSADPRRKPQTLHVVSPAAGPNFYARSTHARKPTNFRLRSLMLIVSTLVAKWLYQICITLSLFGCAYALAATTLTQRFARRADAARSDRSERHDSQAAVRLGVDLRENLASFCGRTTARPCRLFSVCRSNLRSINLCFHGIAIAVSRSRHRACDRRPPARRPIGRFPIWLTCSRDSST